MFKRESDVKVSDASDDANSNSAGFKKNRFTLFENKDGVPENYKL